MPFNVILFSTEKNSSLNSWLLNHLYHRSVCMYNQRWLYIHMDEWYKWFNKKQEVVRSRPAVRLSTHHFPYMVGMLQIAQVRSVAYNSIYIYIYIYVYIIHKCIYIKLKRRQSSCKFSWVYFAFCFPQHAQTAYIYICIYYT